MNSLTVECPYGCPWKHTNKYRKVPLVVLTVGKLGKVLCKVKGSKENVYSYHLRTCPNQPEILLKDKILNESIDEILERHKKLKEKKKKEAKAFTCPYCSRKYKSENLRHLLGCAEKHPGDEDKLQEFFSKV